MNLVKSSIHCVMTCMYQMLEKNTGLGTLHLLHKWKLVPFLTVYWMQSIRISAVAFPPSIYSNATLHVLSIRFHPKFTLTFIL